MGEFMHDDICEQILVRLDAADLIRCKKVCKSWKSLISHPHFVKVHHKRQINLIPYRKAVVPNYLFKYGLEHYMVGSSNGLACITSFYGDEIIVANPWTRQERMLQKLRVSSTNSCWGFGYDALSDDYKVVFGSRQGNLDKTTFHVLSLRSNVWKHIEHMNYICFGAVQIGNLWNGALSWVMYSVNLSIEGLISFDLSKEVFVFKKTRPLDNSIRECSFSAIKEGYVCICYESHEKVSGAEKYYYELYWDNVWRIFCARSGKSKVPYAFIPTTVMPSLISPYLQEGNS